jgi:DNA processing protein
MCDATVVIETGIKGGSVITANLANTYNKDVFAYPGRITDSKSEGCNHLIKNNKAILLTDAEQLIEAMGWKENKAVIKIVKTYLLN